MKQYLKLKLSQKLSPQQIQLMKLIQLPTLDFEQKIQREIEENPALEMGKNSENEKSDDLNDDLNIDDYISDDDTPFYKTSSNNSSVLLIRSIELLLSSLNDTQLSTIFSSLMIHILSFIGINGLPFFLVNHSSELQPTIRMSPNSFAALKCAM